MLKVVRNTNIFIDLHTHTHTHTHTRARASLSYNKIIFHLFSVFIFEFYIS